MTRFVTHTTGTALEPSAGEGHLAAALSAARPALTLTSVELDTTLPWNASHLQRTNGEFFNWSAGKENTFDVIFGNPPYVAWKAVDAKTRSAVAFSETYSGKANLYQMFMHRCIELLAPKGELVFIVPAEWFFATSAAPLRALMAATGAITDVAHCGEEKLFEDADVPAIMIFRFEKGRKQGTLNYWDTFESCLSGTKGQKRKLVCTDHRWLLLSQTLAKNVRNWGTLGDFFEVKVGLVTGADKAFKLVDASSVEPSCVLHQVTTTKGTEPFLFLERYKTVDTIPTRALAHVTAHKDLLLARRISSFDETNWWKYGAVRNIAQMDATGDRFYALAKTRATEPFFAVKGATHFTGGVLGIFPRANAPVSCARAVELLNHPAFRKVFESMLLSSNGKLSLQPATLADTPFPKTSLDVDTFLA